MFESWAGAYFEEGLIPGFAVYITSRGLGIPRSVQQFLVEKKFYSAGGSWRLESTRFISPAVRRIRGSESDVK